MTSRDPKSAVGQYGRILATAWLLVYSIAGVYGRQL